MSLPSPKYWPSARHFSEAMQFPLVCFSNPLLRETLPAVDRLGMPLVTSGQFAYVYKLKPTDGDRRVFAVRCFRGYLGDREQRYRAINAHLKSHNIPALASFTYEPEGILVEGRRFPILFMEWIDGPTLDVYLNEVVARREVLLHLADEWVRLVHALRDAKVAHGDLQHGNIIVERGNLRLVDLDGMFVPEMSGWTSLEVGHQHFQHPARDEKLFNSDLDNFSALVIYLSLISLAERPRLWLEHHDENLLFTKADFMDTKSSSLFQKIKEIGPEHRRLAEVLEAAASQPPASTPCLLELVTAKSKLPGWMTAPLSLEVKERTREAPRREVPPLRSGLNQWRAGAKKKARQMPTTPGSVAVQSLFSEPAPAQKQLSNVPANYDPQDVFKNTLLHARELLKRNFLWWYWGTYLGLEILGLEFFYSIMLAIVAVATVCLTTGYRRALRDSRNVQSTLPTGQALRPLFSSAPLPNTAALFTRQSQPTPPSIFAPALSPPDAIIGSRALGIYHLPHCVWVGRIAKGNRVGFATPAEAVSAGYHPCKVCAP